MHKVQFKKIDKDDLILVGNEINYQMSLSRNDDYKDIVEIFKHVVCIYNEAF